MEEQIRKLQAELEIVKKERDILILEKDKTFIKNRLDDLLTNYRKSDVRKALMNKDYISAMYQTYETGIIQELINTYGYDLVVECMIELYLKEEEK